VSARAALVVAALAALSLAASGVAPAAPSAKRTLVVYSVATGVQFLNQADDRQRGLINNPFNSKTNKLQSKANATGQGPFPGDVTVYSFDLYTSAARKKRAGTAQYTCYYNFAEHALCKVSYELSGDRGTIVASGPVNFNVTGFTLVVTGGTNKYIGASGQVAAVAAAKNSQRLEFDLV
jgi:hypothetical protein